MLCLQNILWQASKVYLCISSHCMNLFQHCIHKICIVKKVTELQLLIKYLAKATTLILQCIAQPRFFILENTGRPFQISLCWRYSFTCQTVDLGLNFSTNLSWSHHVGLVCKKTRKVVGILCRDFYQFSNAHINQRVGRLSMQG